MVKQLHSSGKSTVQIHQDNNNNNNNPGCMWGLFHILDYHHWHVKKVFSHKKKRNARYKRNTISHNQGEEDQQYEVAEAEPLLVRQHGKNLSATGKSYPQNHKKGQDIENRLKEESSKGKILSLPGESQHIDSGKNKASSEYALRCERDGKTKEASINQKLIGTSSNKNGRDIGNKIKKHSDVLEVFRVEKDLFLKFLRELDVGGKKLPNKKSRLTKSGSFPLSSSSKRRSNSPSSTLKHKQNEVWAIPKGERLLDGTQATKVSASSFVKDVSHEKPKPLGSDLGVVSSVKPKQGVSARSSHHGLHHKGWNQLVIHRFKVMKQKIKQALVEFKKSGYQTSAEEIHHRDSPEYSITNDEKEVLQSIDDGVIREYLRSKSANETSTSVNVSNRHEAGLVRRTSSLHESLDKYTELFEKSFSTDVKWHNSKSKSLKLMTEDKMNKSERAPKFSRSNFSLPNIESLGFILHEALLDMNDSTNAEETDNNHVQRKPMGLPLKKDKSIAHVEETEISKVVEKIDEVVTCEQREETHEHESAVTDESFIQENEEISVAIHPLEEVMASLENNLEDDTTIHAQGRELDTKESIMEESKTELPSTKSVFSLTSSLPNTDADVGTEDTTNKSSENHSLLFKSDTYNDSNFKFVKAIFQYSGIMGSEQIQVQHTIDQALKPSLLMNLDASLRQEIESSGEESIKSYDRQLLLLNLVNEVLLEIYEVSPTYFPRPFSFNYRLHPMPKDEYLLKEVWGCVNSYLSLRPELDQTLDDVVGRDLAKRSGWMNLQQEEEYAALELEEMIIDDLLDEIIFS